MEEETSTRHAVKPIFSHKTAPEFDNSEVKTWLSRIDAFDRLQK